MSLADLKGRTSQARRWLAVALVLVVFFVVGGAPVPHNNETHYLAKAKHYWQPEWCAGDMFLESADAHLAFYWTVGWLTNWFDLPTVAWIGRCVAWLLLAISWQRLSATVSSLPLRAVLSAMLLTSLIEWTNFAGEWVVGGVEGKCFAYAFIFWGLAAMVEGRWNRAWPLFGLASAFHVVVGGWATLLAGGLWLCQSRPARTPLVKMLPWLMLGGLISLAGVVPALQLTRDVPAETVLAGNQIYVFDRLPHHLAPLTMVPEELGRKALRFSLLLVGFAWLHFLVVRQPVQQDQEDGSRQRWLLLAQFAVATLLLSAVGLAWELATWNNHQLAARFLKFYPFRLADVAVPLATATGVVWLVDRLLHRETALSIVLLVLALGLPLTDLLLTSRTRLENPVPPADRRLRDQVAWVQACYWAREHSPEGSLFLVPRFGQSFKWNAHRPDLITWKDMPQNATDLLRWRERYYEVHYHFDQEGKYVAYRSLAAQGTARIKALAEKYALDFVLTAEYPPLDLPVAHSNEQYTIYDLRSPKLPAP